MQRSGKGVIIGRMNIRLNDRGRFVFVMTALLAWSACTSAADVRVANAWARASAPGQTSAAIYMEVKSDTDAVLTAAESARAERAELHAMKVENGVMRMRPLERVELGAGKTVKFEPNGLHLMLVNVKQPLKAGERVPVTLTVQARGGAAKTLKLQAEVRSLHGGHNH